MPRKSTQNTEGTTVTRRMSARIAAVQAASPAKSPVKATRPKRRSTEPKKSMSEDTESLQSLTASENTDEVNGVENSSSKDGENTSNVSEVPAKKPKLDTETNEAVKDVAEGAEDASKKAIQSDPDTADYEVVEKSDVPHPESEEVKAAISAQGEDGQLLVGYVQVDKEELPSAASLEVKNVTADADSTVESVKAPENSTLTTSPEVHETEKAVNGESKTEKNDEVTPTEATIDPNSEEALQAKSTDPKQQTATAPAAGDASADHNTETVQ